MTESSGQTLISHLEALRHTLLHCLGALVLSWPLGYLATPYCIAELIRWCCPPELGPLNFFSPMEVFLAQLKLALVLAAVLSYPYCAWQVWRFLLPALYEKERRALKWWITSASVLFVTGALFCAGVILPIVMRFSLGFASDGIRPMLGLSNFLNLAGWMMLAFGVMFQFPLVVLLSVRFGLVSTATLREKRSYVIVLILILAAILTPPDVVSQILLGVPTWLLFEAGLLLSGRMERRRAAEEKLEEERETAEAEADATLTDFYEQESKRPGAGE